MLIEFKEHLNYLEQIRSGQVKTALGIGVQNFDEYLRFKSSNFNIILGHANVGKTSVALYLMLLYTIKHKKGG